MFPKSLTFKLLAIFVIFAIGVAYAYYNLKRSRTLPTYNPANLTAELVDSSMQKVTKNHKIDNFSLINQNGKIVTEKDLEGKIYVADFFFTTCKSICPKMEKQMQRLIDAYADDDKVLFVSHTVQPEVDSVSVLKQYAIDNEINTDKWMLLTGAKKEIYNLARKSYFVVTTKGDGGKEDFIHTENFVLVDPNKRLRGFYDGTSTEEINQLIDDIEVLEFELERNKK